MAVVQDVPGPLPRVYGPRMDRDRPDLLGDPDDEAYDDDLPGGREPLLPAVLAPEALALAAVVLAAVSLTGLGLLNGPPYLPQAFFSDRPDRSSIVLAAFLGAAFALLPTALGVLALRRLPDLSPYRAAAGAAVLLAGIALVLRLVLAARAAADDSVQFVQF